MTDTQTFKMLYKECIKETEIRFLPKGSVDFQHLPGLCGKKSPQELDNPFEEYSQEDTQASSICDVRIYKLLQMLYHTTGISVKEIDLTNPGVIRVFQDSDSIGLDFRRNRGFRFGTRGIGSTDTIGMTDILLMAQPASFSDLVRSFGLSFGTGTWTQTIRDSVYDGTLKITDLFSCREDVLELLLHAGADIDSALCAAIEIRKGRGDSEKAQKILQNYDIGKQKIQMIKSIRYLPIRSWNLFYTMNACYLAFYKVYYPQDFYDSFFEIYGNERIMNLISEGWDEVVYYLDGMEIYPQYDGTNDLESKRLLEVALEMYERGYTLSGEGKS